MHQDPPTHSGLFLSCDALIEYISIQFCYFHQKYYGLCPYIVNVVVASQQRLKYCKTGLFMTCVM